MDHMDHPDQYQLQSLWTDSHQILPACSSARGTPYIFLSNLPETYRTYRPLYRDQLDQVTANFKQ